MNKLLQKFGPFSTVLALALLIVVGCATTNGSSQQGIKVTLTGDKEVPPVKTAASGNGTFVITSDKAVSGSITTSGIEGTAAHIHDSVPGQTMCGAKNGPVIVPLTKGPDNTWSVSAGAKLTDAQYASYQAGNLYVNVHSAANKGGEICSQLTPVK
jgi:hypothetical protein